ncbi:MAG: hypothetical protein AAF809_00415 [Bacteroidota bacterium]
MLSDAEQFELRHFFGEARESDGTRTIDAIAFGAIDVEDAIRRLWSEWNRSLELLDAQDIDAFKDAYYQARKRGGEGNPLRANVMEHLDHYYHSPRQLKVSIPKRPVRKPRVFWDRFETGPGNPNLKTGRRPGVEYFAECATLLIDENGIEAYRAKRYTGSPTYIPESLVDDVAKRLEETPAITKKRLQKARGAGLLELPPGIFLRVKSR